MPRANRAPLTAAGGKTRAAASGRVADAVLYGATGYTGHLAARAMERSGVSMVLAGRNRESLQRASGVLAPAQAFDPAETLDSMADLGVSWRRL